MAKITDIPTMPIEELRPYVQRALELEEWPGDWNAAGMIIERCSVSLSRAAFPPLPYSAIVMGKEIGGGIAGGHDPDPKTAIFRGYLRWRSTVKSKP